MGNTLGRKAAVELAPGFSCTEETSRDEARMIAAILAGDAQLYQELIRPYERNVYMVALSYMKNEVDAEYIAQETFLNAFHHLAQFPAKADFGTWLVCITLDEAHSRHRSETSARTDNPNQTFKVDDPTSPALLRNWPEVSSEALEREEVQQMMQRAIVNLPGIYFEVLLMRDVEGMSVAKTAAALSITVANVKVRLQAARMTLQKHLAPQLLSVNGGMPKYWSNTT